jgi:hypothetical protein
MVCTICSSLKHVAASCPYRPRPIDRVIATLAIVLLVWGWIGQAFAHDAHLYDPECCGGGDCAPVSHVTYVAANSASAPVMVVTTPLGTKPKTDKTTVRESRDHRMHACFYQDRLWCLYLPPGQ